MKWVSNQTFYESRPDQHYSDKMTFLSVELNPLYTEYWPISDLSSCTTLIYYLFVLKLKWKFLYFFVFFMFGIAFEKEIYFIFIEPIKFHYCIFNKACRCYTKIRKSDTFLGYTAFWTKIRFVKWGAFYQWSHFIAPCGMTIGVAHSYLFQMRGLTWSTGPSRSSSYIKAICQSQLRIHFIYSHIIWYEYNLDILTLPW